MKRLLCMMSVLAALSAGAQTLTVKMAPGENWWGACSAFGRGMPFTEKSRFMLDLRRENSLHQTLSFLCSDKGRAVWCPRPFAVNIAGGVMRLESDDAEITLKENAGKTLAEAFRYASRTRFPPSGTSPDELFFSAPQYNTWSELIYNQNEKDILAYAKSMLDNGLPPGIFMIDENWQHGFGVWEFDMRKFSDPKGMVEKLHGMGFKVLLWVCPFVAMDTLEYHRVAWGERVDRLGGWPTKGGFLTSSLKPSRGRVPPAATVNWWEGTSALLDFSHPNAVAWFTEQLDRLIRDYKVDGFKFDGGEVPYYAATMLPNGAPGKMYAHNRKLLPAEQSALYAAFAFKYPVSEVRNAYGMAGKPMILRLHDKPHRWDAVQRLVPDMIAAGMIGCPFICPDLVGGGSYTSFLKGSKFDQELFVRYAQLAALSPMMQISASPWRLLDERHQKLFKEAVALRQKFAPQIVTLVRQAGRDGEPILRNLEYNFPAMGYADIKDEFMLGTDILVAPVVVKGQTERTVQLPPGCWRGDDGREYAGPVKITISTPLERLPYFTKLPQFIK